MRQSRGQTETPSPRISLHLSASTATAFERVILPWFETAAKSGIAGNGLTAVVTPYRSHAHFLRAQLLGRGISLLGVRFLTPPQLRDLLLRGNALDIPLREHLRLLLATTAEHLTANTDNNRSPDVLVAKSVARDPDNFLRAIDQLYAAGWNLDQLQPATLREVATQFEQRVRDCGFTFVHQADRVASRNNTEKFDALLISGFDGAHWPLWPLLSSAARCSDAT